MQTRRVLVVAVLAAASFAILRAFQSPAARPEPVDVRLPVAGSAAEGTAIGSMEDTASTPLASATRSESLQFEKVRTVLALEVLDVRNEPVEAKLYFRLRPDVALPESVLESRDLTPSELAAVLAEGVEVPVEPGRRVLLPFDAAIEVAAIGADQIGGRRLRPVAHASPGRLDWDLPLRPRHRVRVSVRDTRGQAISGFPVELRVPGELRSRGEEHAAMEKFLRSRRALGRHDRTDAPAPKDSVRLFVGSTDVLGELTILSPHLKLATVADLASWQVPIRVAGATPGLALGRRPAWQEDRSAEIDFVVPPHGEVEVRGSSSPVPDANGIHNDIYLVGEDGTYASKVLSPAGNVVFSPVGLEQNLLLVCSWGAYSLRGPVEAGERVVWDLEDVPSGTLDVHLSSSKGLELPARDFQVEIAELGSAGFYSARSVAHESWLRVSRVPVGRRFRALVRARGAKFGVKQRVELAGPLEPGVVSKAYVRFTAPVTKSSPSERKLQLRIHVSAVPRAVASARVYVVLECEDTTVSGACRLDGSGSGAIQIPRWIMEQRVRRFRIQTLPFRHGSSDVWSQEYRDLGKLTDITRSGRGFLSVALSPSRASGRRSARSEDRGGSPERWVFEFERRDDETTTWLPTQLSVRYLGRRCFWVCEDFDPRRTRFRVRRGPEPRHPWSEWILLREAPQRTRARF